MTTFPVRNRLAGQLILGALYWAVGETVVRNLTVAPTIALVWPGAGIALAAFLRLGRSYWPAVFFGALGIGFTGLPLGISIPVALGNVLGPLMAATLLIQTGFTAGFPRQRDLGWFLLIGLGLLPLPGATIAALTTPAANNLPAATVFANWWLGDSLGVLLLAPLLMADVASWREAIRARGRVAELVLVLLGNAITTALAFFSDTDVRSRVTLPVPLVLWAAVRLGPVGAAAATLLLAAISTLATSTGHGPFAVADPATALWLSWTYLALVTLAGMMIAALAAERDVAVAAVRASEDRYRAIIEESPDLICRFRDDGTLTFVNEAYCRTFGRRREDLIGQRFATLMPSDEQAFDRLRQALHPAMAPFTLEHRAVVDGGETRWQQWTNVAVHDEEGRFVEFQAIGRDVTERRLAEEALRASEARYRAIVDAEPECVMIIDADGRLVEINAAGIAMLEAESAGRVRGREVVGLVRPQDRTAFRELHQRVFAGGTGSLEFGIEGLRGTERLVQATAAPMRDEHGPVSAMLALTRDVTDERRAERERAEADRLIRRVTEIMPGALYVYDVNLDRTVFLSRSAGRMLGLDPERTAASDVSIAELLAPEDRPRFEAQMAGLRRARDEEIHTWEYRVTHRDGTSRHFQSRDTVLTRGPDGAVHQIVGAVTDVTERHDAEARVRRMAAFPELNPSPVLELAADGTVTYANDAAMAMARTGEPAGTTVLLPPDTAAIVRACLANGADRQRVELIREGRTLSCSFFPITALGVVHCYVTDVTEAVEMRRRLERSQRIESIGQLAGGVAHDFNNLLQVIGGFAALARKPGLGESERNEHLGHVLDATGRASQLTRQLLAFGRRQPLRIADLDLNEVVGRMLPMLRRLIEERIAIDFVPAAVAGNVRGDRGQLEQVVLNLCINARDAIPASGRITIVTETVTLDGDPAGAQPGAAPGRYFRIAVTDDGAGMTKQVLDRIFEPFFTTKGPDRGSGLGLAMAYGLVQQHQGTISVTSEPGRGSTFTVHLPIVEPAVAAAGAPADRPPLGGSERILVVEDEAAVRTFAARLLVQAGYQVREAADGDEAVACLRADPGAVDLVLMDVVMPRLGGVEAGRMMQSIRPDLPLVFASGYGGAEPAEAAPSFLRPGPVLDKPYQPDELLRAVRAALDGRSGAAP